MDNPEVPVGEGCVPKNSLHGHSYQIKLLMIAVLHLQKMKKEDSNLTYTITVEDPAEGMFDDIVLRYGYRGSERILCIQAKHKTGKNKKVTLEDLTTTAKGAPYAILKYFECFLEKWMEDAKTEQVATTEQKLILCTNAILHEDVSNHLQVQNTDTLKEDDLCYIFGRIKSTIYRFNVDKMKGSSLEQIVDVLKKSCDSYRLIGLAEILASAVFKKTPLDLNTRNKQRFPMLIKFRNAIKSHILGDKKEKNFYHLKKEFCDGTSSPEVCILRQAFEIACQKCVKADEDVWDEVRKNGILLKDPPKQSEDCPSAEIPEDFDTNEVIAAFFKKFLLVVGSQNENELTQTVMDYLKQTNTTELSAEEVLAVYNEMFSSFFNWVKDQKLPLTSLKEQDIEVFFDRIRIGVKYIELRSISSFYEDSLGLDRYQMDLRPECLDKSPLYKFLREKSESGPFHCQTQYNLKSVMVDVKQIIRAFQALQSEQEIYKALFIDNVMFKKHMETIKTMLSLNTNRIILVIACTNGSQEILNELVKYKRASHGRSREYPIKIILIEESDGRSNDDALVEHLLVSNLTENSKEPFPENKTLCIFGTKIHLTQMVREEDDLTDASELLECLGQLHGKSSLVEQKFKEIEKWYIQRRLCKLQTTNVVEDTFENDERFSLRTLYRALRSNSIFYESDLTTFINDHVHGAADLPQLGDESHASTKVCIVLDETYSGKSTYLTWLGWNLRMEDAFKLIVRLSAIEVSTDFEQILKKSTSDGQEQHEVDDTEALRILFKFVHLALFVRDINRHSVEDTNRERAKVEKCANLMSLQGGQIILNETASEWVQLTVLQWIELRLFSAKFNDKKLVILCDEFDKAAPHYKDTMFRLFSRWQTFEGIYKIYITSRPYEFKNEFETLFRDRAQFYCLEPFNDYDRLHAVHIFMQSEFEQYQCCEEPKKHYLLGILERILSNDLVDPSVPPLFIHMRLQVLLPLVKEHVDFVGGTISKEILVKSKLVKYTYIPFSSGFWFTGVRM